MVPRNGKAFLEIEQRALIAGCLNKERRAQNKLYTQYYPYLYGVCLSYMKDFSLEEAEDLLQEVFLKIYDKLHTLKSPGTLKWWMKKVCINMAINKIRSVKKIAHSKVDLEEGRFLPNEGNVDVVSKLSHDFLLRVSEQLPNRQGKVFKLFAVEGYLHKEIAEELGIVVSTSRTQYRKARIRMQKLILDGMKKAEESDWHPK